MTIIRTFITVFCKLTRTNEFQRQIVRCQQREIQHSAARMLCTTCLYELERSQIANFIAGNASTNSPAEKRTLNSRERRDIRIWGNSISTETHQTCAYF